METKMIVIHDNQYTPFVVVSGGNLCGPLIHPVEATVEVIEECLRQPYSLKQVYAVHPYWPERRVHLTFG